jgi:glycosyltransferase involved in cell wall biosynthesis
MVYSPRWGSRYATILFKYVAQSFKTWRILWRERPHTVFVMTPPVFACLAVLVYCRLVGAGYIIDAHSGAFLDPRWSGTLFLHRFFSRRARATLVTNEHLAAVVRDWGARAIIVPDVPVQFPDVPRGARAGGCTMTFVTTFAVDEPIREFLLAASGAPDITFHVTGNYRKYDPRVLALKPRNVEFTGFISRERYVGLLLDSDAIISLTTLDHTMQRAAYEAVYLGKPVITSNFGLLRQEFALGTVHVDITAEAIRSGVEQMRDNIGRLAVEAGVLRQRKLERWQRAYAELEPLVQQGTADDVAASKPARDT